MEFLWGVIINRWIWIDDLQFFIEIFNLRVIDECNHFGYSNVPMWTQERSRNSDNWDNSVATSHYSNNDCFGIAWVR